MIKEKEINLRINNNMVKYYEKKLNRVLTSGQIVTLKVDDLSNGSHAKITCVCDLCGKEKVMTYKDYNYVIKSDNDKKYYCKICANIKSRKTMMEKYGHEHALQCDDFFNKSRKTLFENYGVYHPISSEIIRNRFNDTMIEKYGVKNALENKNILSKMMDKTFKQYGMYYVETDEFKKKSKKTCITKYDNEYYMGTDVFRIRSKNSTMIKYDVEYPMQNKDILDKAFISALKMKKYKDTEIYYQGTYEKDFLDKCDKLNILDKIKRGCSIKYDMNEKHLIYFPDFYIENKNLLIEIKSLYWYNKHKDKNTIKENTCKELGFKYLLIMNKNYEEFLNLI